MPRLSLSDAARALAERERLVLQQRRRGLYSARREGKRVQDADIATASRFFFVRGEVKLSRAVTRMEALVRRGVPGQGIQPVNVLWVATVIKR